MDQAFVLRVLSLIAEHEDYDSLWWRTDGEYAPVTFMINCNDLFWWACGDCVRLTPENIDVLDQSYKDISGLTGGDRVALCAATNLFCCRIRKMRPQGCCYPEEKALWPLFDACGPERPIDMGNPYPPGGRAKTTPPPPPPSG